MKRIGILGGGVWGSALAKLLSNSSVCVFARDEKIVKSINEHKFNPILKYAVFNKNVTATSDLTDLQKTDYLIIGSKKPTLKKIDEAKKLHIQILSEKVWNKIVKE